MAEAKRYKMFVSYSRHDEALVRPLADMLGISEDAVFFDVTTLKPGDDWQQEIATAIESASIFVLCWCCGSSRSKSVAEEIALAFRGPVKRVVPVLFCEMPLPKHLDRWQWIDLRGRVVHTCRSPHGANMEEGPRLDRNLDLRDRPGFYGKGVGTLPESLPDDIERLLEFMDEQTHLNLFEDRIRGYFWKFSK
jgi:hypothetical protein